jgi:hypothetical protein
MIVALGTTLRESEKLANELVAASQIPGASSDTSKGQQQVPIHGGQRLPSSE